MKVQTRQSIMKDGREGVESYSNVSLNENQDLLIAVRAKCEVLQENFEKQ